MSEVNSIIIRMLVTGITIAIGMGVLKLSLRWMTRAIEKKEKDPIFSKFLGKLIGGLGTILIVAFGLTIGGFNSSWLVAILVTILVALGVALQDSIKDTAAGLRLIFFQTFKKGDYVDVSGQKGVVQEITLLNTSIKTFDNKTIILPNDTVAKNIITNFSDYDKRRGEIVFEIEYGADVEQIKKIIEKILKDEERVLEEPNTYIFVNRFAPSGVELKIRFWTLRAKRFRATNDLREQIHSTFIKNDISFAFPKTEIIKSKDSIG